MKFLTTVLLFLFGIAAAETITISHFLYVGVNGYPQISFALSVDGVKCAADHFEVPSTGYSCDVPEWTFDILEEQGRELRLRHIVDGQTLSGDFHINMNGPIPTVLDQVGTSTSELQ